MRSRLTHGDGAPTHIQVASVNPDLERFVRDLIDDRLTSDAE